MKKIVFGMIWGVLIFTIGTFNANAASFESMKDHVQDGEGFLFNPVSGGVMTNESSIEYVEIVEEKIEELGTNEVTEDVMKASFEATKDLATLPVIEDSTHPFLGKPMGRPTIMPTGPNIPNGLTLIDRLPSQSYVSNPFSARGWRYSETRFGFANTANNPYYGVRATIDSFYFHTPEGKFVVPANGGYVYYYSQSIIGTKYASYFSTYNPIPGCRYYIY